MVELIDRPFRGLTHAGSMNNISWVITLAQSGEYNWSFGCTS